MTKLFTSVLVLALALAAAPASADTCEGVELPSAVTVDGTRLVLNGMGVREATVLNVNVYVAGLYLEARNRNAEQILSANGRRQLVLHFVRSVDRDDITEAFSEGFQRNSASTVGSLQTQINQLNGWMAAMNEGDTMTFTFVPGTGLTVKVGNRTRGTIAGDDFARAFFAIWLGATPPNRGLKAGLLGGECG
jgi:hypothetical protein